MSTDFLHGVEVLQVDDGSRPVRTVKSAVIGLVGTAPDADATTFPLNRPVLLTSPIQGDKLKSQVGPVTGTLYHAVQQIFAQAGAAIVVVRVAEGAGANDAAKLAATLPNVIGGTQNGEYVGMQALIGAKSIVGVQPRVLCAPGFTSVRPLGGLRNLALSSGGTGYTSAPAVSFTGGGGTGATAVATVVAGVVTNLTITNPGTGFTSTPTVVFTGGGGTGAAATATVGALANPVAAAFAGVADRLRAMALIAGPNTTDADAIDYRNDHGSKRLFIIDPWVKALIGPQIGGTILDMDATAAVAGMIAKSDNDRGFWWSPSNQTINAIIGTGRSVDFTLGDVNSRANLLNENEIATIIREDGFRLWGNRTCSADPKWAFLSVVRTADIINDSLQRAHLWAVDRCINRAYVTAVVNSVNAYLRQLKAQGAILGGKCWADPTLNTPENIADGKVFFDFDFTPPFPAERVTFRSHLVNDYVSEVLVAA